MDTKVLVIVLLCIYLILILIFLSVGTAAVLYTSNATPASSNTAPVAASSTSAPVAASTNSSTSAPVSASSPVPVPAPTYDEAWGSGSQIDPSIRDSLLGWLDGGAAANFTVNNFLRDPRGHQNWGAALAILKTSNAYMFNQIPNKPAIVAQMLSVDKSNPANTLTDKQKLWFTTNFV